MPPKDALGRKADQAIAVMVLALLVCAGMMMVISSRTHILDVEVRDTDTRDYDAEEQANWKREEALQAQAEKSEVCHSIPSPHSR